MTQKLKLLSPVICICFMVCALFAPAKIFAACAAGETCGGNGSAAVDATSGSSGSSSNPDCNNPNPSASSLNSCVKNDQIITDLNVIVNILAAFVGVAVTAVIVLGGVQYSMAGDSPDAVGKAKQRITNGLIALVVYILTYAFLQYIIPGGVFG